MKKIVLATLFFFTVFPYQAKARRKKDDKKRYYIMAGITTGAVIVGILLSQKRSTPDEGDIKSYRKNKNIKSYDRDNNIEIDKQKVMSRNSSKISIGLPDAPEDTIVVSPSLEDRIRGLTRTEECKYTDEEVKQNMRKAFWETLAPLGSSILNIVKNVVAKEGLTEQAIVKLWISSKDLENKEFDIFLKVLEKHVVENRSSEMLEDTKITIMGLIKDIKKERKKIKIEKFYAGQQILELLESEYTDISKLEWMENELKNKCSSVAYVILGIKEDVCDEDGKLQAKKKDSYNCGLNLLVTSNSRLVRNSKEYAEYAAERLLKAVQHWLNRKKAQQQQKNLPLDKKPLERKIEGLRYWLSTLNEWKLSKSRCQFQGNSFTKFNG